MAYSISDRLLYREITEPYKPSFLGKRKNLANRGVSAQSYSSVRGIYGDKLWVDDLDIVNELGGHTGCVNALSWSKSGRLLASGSDDTHVNIHTYQAESSSMPFNLVTTIQTGHEANIFSVKFMPHSNDNTIVSCAGDGQVRVFDIEYAAKHATPAHISPSSIRHHSGVNLDELYRGVQFLTPSNTNGRVYRSHSDRVKRIVTESSPNLFLTCSEDGEVRQWDLRLPSSAYPAHPRRGERGPPVPPPLISYKRFQLDLNTISCSGSQPHYIVLGGVHLHAFLHDRRMLGRDIDAERGSPSSSSLSGSEHDEDLMSKATKCVRRFAPNGKPKMQTDDSGHITACKISDAYPNEMIGSWSGDHIYSFNLVSSPDASESRPQESNVTTDGTDAKKTKPSAEKKRKRGTDAAAAASGASAERLARDGNRELSPPDAEDELEGDVALRVRYGNGQSEDIVLNRPRRNPVNSEVAEVAQTEERALRFAHSVRRVRKVLFSPFTPSRDTLATAQINEALAQIATLLPEMETACNERDYVHISSHGGVTEAEESRMRTGRQVACFFVQASGTVSRFFGGTLRTTDPVQTQGLLARYNSLEIPDDIGLSHWEMFCYQLMGCIIAWLEHGRVGLLDYVKQSAFLARHLHVDANAGEEVIEQKIIPHLLDLTVVTKEQRRLVNLDVNRFESDATRRLFGASRDAVTSFATAVSEDPAESSEAEKQSRHAYWGLKVVRSLLFAAAEHVNFAYVNHAFAGPRGRTEPDEGISQQDVDPDELDDPAESVQQISVVEAGAMDASATGATEEGTTSLSSGAIEQIIAAQDFRAALRDHGIDVSVSESDGEGQNASDLEFSPGNSDAEGTDDEEDALLNDYDEDDDRYNDNDDDDDDGYDDEDDGDENQDGNRNPRSFLDASLGYARDRGRVEADVPCSTHTRVYSGHCNVKTVKDVNFYGLDDEYVVSGSDSGHLFIWDRKTGKLLNLLQGDGEVVNVIQGHPYEPMLAVSGIDHTIKIFSPDTRAQERARHGLDLGTSNHRSHGVSRLQMRSRIRRHVDRNQADNESRGGSGVHTPNVVDPTADAASATPTAADDDDDDDFDLDNERPTNGGLSSCKRMRDSYQIMSQNDVERNGGMQDAMMTRSFLAQLAVHIQTRRAAARTTQGGGQAGGEDGDGCSVM